MEEEKTTVSAGEAISISMRTKREEEGALQHQELHHQWSSNANAPNLATGWRITNGDGLMAVVGVWA